MSVEAKQLDSGVAVITRDTLTVAGGLVGALTIIGCGMFMALSEQIARLIA